MCLLAGGVPVVIQAGQDQDFKITPEQLEAAITEKTKLVVINSPSNPSGKSYSNSELAALGAVLVKYPNILVATDDMYEHILWCDEPFSNIVMACPELYNQTIVLNGVSKAKLLLKVTNHASAKCSSRLKNVTTTWLKN